MVFADQHPEPGLFERAGQPNAAAAAHQRREPVGEPFEELAPGRSPRVMWINATPASGFEHPPELGQDAGMAAKGVQSNMSR